MQGRAQLPLAAMGAVTLLFAAASPAFAQPGAKPFKSAGAGTEASLSPSGCQFTQAGCTVRSTGTAKSSHMGHGPYVSTLTVEWALATSNGAGGYCAPASGTAEITASNGDVLYQSETGELCEVGATGANVPHSFTGTFTNTGGTGRFATASGKGTVTGGDDGSGKSNYTDTGTISY